MADYKLVLDIDEKVLAKKMEDAMKAVGIDSSIFGGKEGTKHAKQLESITKNINKNITIRYDTDIKGKKALIKLQQKSKQMQFENNMALDKAMGKRQMLNKQATTYITLLRQATGRRGGNVGRNIGSLLGGRAGGAIGGGIDAIKPMMQLYKAQKSMQHLGDGTKDDPNFVGPHIPGRKGMAFAKARNTKAGQAVGKLGKAAGIVGKAAAMPVKVAGFMAGMAGGAGLGKMIIDSSPMLQSMLKLLNVGIMLILRPIGDFIGFMLRPLLLQFVKKVAIPAYRDGAKFAKEWGTKIGKALLLLFTNPAEFLEKAIVHPIMGNLEKLFQLLSRRLQILGVILNPLNAFKSEKERNAMIEAIMIQKTDGHDEFGRSDQQIDKKWPGLFGADKMGTCSVAKNLQTLQDTQHEDLYKVNEQIQTVKDKMDEVIGGAGSGSVVDGVTESNRILDEINVKISALVALGMTQAAAVAAVQNGVEIIDGEVFHQAEMNGSGEMIRKDEIDGVHAQTQQDARMELARLEEQARQLFLEMNRHPTKIPNGPYGNYANEYFGCGGAGRPQEDKSQLNVTEKGFDRISKIMAAYNEYRTGKDGKSNSQSSDGMGGYEGITELCRAKTIVKGMLDSQLITAEEAQIQYEAIAEAAALSSSSQAITFTHFRGIEQDSKMAAFASDKSVKSHEGIMKELQRAKAWIDAAVARLTKSKISSEKSTSKKGALDYLKTPEAPLTKTTNPDSGWKITLTCGTVLTHKTNNGGLPMTKKMLDYYKSIGGSVRGFASGGIINEPVLGFGQNTGKRYSFGEAGPERVTPGTGLASSGGGATNNINITMNGVKDMHEFERMLKPVVLKLLKDSTSRVGVV